MESRCPLPHGDPNKATGPAGSFTNLYFHFSPPLPARSALLSQLFLDKNNNPALSNNATHTRLPGRLSSPPAPFQPSFPRSRRCEGLSAPGSLMADSKGREAQLARTHLPGQHHKRHLTELICRKAIMKNSGTDPSRYTKYPRPPPQTPLPPLQKTDMLHTLK
ncbi:hypothetical protein DR999_PMT10793 [Platysternon megacephalum]|uniref:Uncharacterized protein n=1 Tax=Platysternon megacephalum TaxID=55544 RepID=A0A4D9EJM9_9SAUR|nr:hypothetical protein DR999_PMT10793 [Platysternon megacephalum]